MFDIPRKGKRVKAFWIEQNKRKGFEKGCLIFTFFNKIIYVWTKIISYPLNFPQIMILQRKEQQK